MSCCCHVPQGTVPRLCVHPSNQRIGHHFPFQGNLYQTLTQPGADCYCLQMYVTSRLSYASKNLSQEDKEKSLRFCQKRLRSFAIHCSLVSNLSLPPEDDRAAKSIEHVGSLLSSVDGLPGTCVLHIGKLGSIEQVARNLNDLQIPRGQRVPYLLLENAAGQGTELGRNWDQLRRLFEAIDTNKVGLCIDTQHSFASGLCSFSDHEQVVRLFDLASDCATIGLIHLNDSKTGFRSQVDRHECIGQGHIWHRDDESLRSLLDRCYEQSLDAVLETPSLDDLPLVLNRYTHPILL
jgi:deoxyribonuclease-4